MSVELASNSYGKSAVRLLKVERSSGDAVHVIRDLTVDVAIAGAFTDVHISGDNSRVLPTDTMKNTVYAMAREHRLGEPEEFAALLAAHFLGASASAERVDVKIAEHGWRRLEVEGRPHEHSFERGSAEQRIASVTASRGRAVEVWAGIENLVILKSAQSAFRGYLKDRYTTLEETSDRILATAMSARWRYRAGEVAYGHAFDGARQRLVETFATHESASVQHTLYAMAAAVLEERGDVEEVAITMPNKHHLLAKLSPFGLDNPNEVFVPTEEPYGLIQATVRRAD